MEMRIEIRNIARLRKTFTGASKVMAGEYLGCGFRRLDNEVERISLETARFQWDVSEALVGMERRCDEVTASLSALTGKLALINFSDHKARKGSGMVALNAGTPVVIG